MRACMDDPVAQNLSLFDLSAAIGTTTVPVVLEPAEQA